MEGPVAPGERRSPVIELETALGRLALTWENCRICTFGNTDYDHIEVQVQTPEGMEVCASAASEDLIHVLMENEYPHNFRPVPDQATVDWYVERHTADLDEELKNVLDT